MTAGVLAQFGLLFAYYATSGNPVTLIAAVAGLGLGAAFASSGRKLQQNVRTPRLRPWPAAFIVGLLMVPFLINRSAWDEIDRDETLPSTFTVMTYNIQTGISLDNRWDLEATARVIEAQGSDVVILQEVTRGWAIGSGVDEARWLSRRLDMNLAWGPSSLDGLWGVAILSRGTVISSEMTIYSIAENWRRGVLGVAIATERGPVYVYATHLDAADDANANRVAQATEVIALAAGRNPAIAGGDFNALPDSDVVATMLAADFVDTGAELPAGTGTSAEGDRIDYLFVRGAVTVESISVPEVWASDHRPLVIRITLS